MRPLKIEISNRVKKHEILKACIARRSKECRGLFINEELIKTRNSLFYELRQIKKNHHHPLILFTRDGIIKARKTQTGKLYNINSEKDLNVFLGDSGISRR